VPFDTQLGPNFWDGRHLSSVVESARSRCLASKELGHVIMCAYGVRTERKLQRAVLRDVPSRAGF